MKIAFFSTQSYDRLFFNRYKDQHEIIFHEALLSEQTVELVKDCEAICVFVNDQLNKEVISALAANGVKLIALRSAGFNNVDLESA